MVIGAAAILAILTRQPDAGILIEAIEAAPPPLLVSPLSVYEAVIGLARAKGGTESADPAVLGRAREAVSAFLDVTGAREVVLTSDLARRALDHAVGQADGAEACFARACAAGYRTRLLAP